MNAGTSGLGNEDAQKRLEKHGRNMIERQHGFRAIKLLLNQFRSMLVFILVIAGAVAFAFGEALDAIAIFAIVLINAGLGFFQEYKAEKAMEALRKMTALRAVVLREGRHVLIDAEELVPGDIVLLEEGSKVPADLRLIEAVNLRIDEALLTGESTPMRKETAAVSDKATVAERRCIAFANTIVTYGRGKGVVVSTGMHTEFGKVAEMVRGIKEEDTPLKQRLGALASQLGIAVLFVVVLIFAAGMWAGRGMLEMFMVAVSLGVAAMPEGLPAVITITLGIGILAMARRNALVRKMPSIEALGSATVICTDKTGTLTRNEMIVEKVYANRLVVEVSGEGYAPKGDFSIGKARIDPKKDSALNMLLKIAVHCNNATLQKEGKAYGIIGDPTEGALACAAEKAGIKADEERVDELPFSSKRKMMTTVHVSHGERIAYTKGALDRVLEGCTHIFEEGEEKRLLGKRKTELKAEAGEFGRDAYRVLGFSYRKLDDGKIEESGMVFAGMTAMRDPPREGVAEAIETCKGAGIKVKIITGDDVITASAIAARVGLDGGAITGRELDAMGKREFAHAVRKHTVFARVEPEHKYRIVEALMESGEIVAVTGDGVNDAPALKKADVGVAMGIKGTDVAKEASDIILKDDDFSTIVVAVREGRRVYSNIRGFIKYLLSANVNEIAVVAATTLAHLPLALLPLQILWMNIATDSLPALALGTEKAERGAMKRPPHNPKEGIIRPMLPFLAVATLLAFGVTMAAYFYGLGVDEAMGIDAHDLGAGSYARTMLFSAAIIFEMVLVFGCRFEGRGVFDENPFSNRYLVAAVLVSIAMQFAVVYVAPLQAVFRTVPLAPFDWVLIFALCSSALAVPYINNFLLRIFSWANALRSHA
ncbi:HAD-IC family P-type ATPase [Candidatus Micrarchaeota archaeon]|nr:HAD-IC family P-type ATPase [Candidatus Micrarchaeota archaeon]MBU1939892.1 HAD-IC family P-type ATPase [Candidatus Micrarchaeota archaeon]